MAKGWNDSRPMSPHITAWKWHPTMLSSILHRATGIVLYISLIKICIFLASIASGRAGFEMFESLIYSPLGAFSFFIFTGVMIYHLLNGLRHLVWDAGKGFDPKLSNTISIIVIVLAALAAALLTFILTGSVT